MNISISELEEILMEDLDENDYVLITDVSDGKSKKVSLQTLLSFLQMMGGEYRGDCIE